LKLNKLVLVQGHKNIALTDGLLTATRVVLRFYATRTMTNADVASALFDANRDPEILIQQMRDPTDRNSETIAEEVDPEIPTQFNVMVVVKGMQAMICNPENGKTAIMKELHSLSRRCKVWMLQHFQIHNPWHLRMKLLHSLSIWLLHHCQIHNP
jgi:hypothetical protein